jgi:septal ring factor EnvC (AmiA/AmiB activator)
MTAPSEERIAKLETQKQYMSREIAEMRDDIRDIKRDVQELAENERKRNGFVFGIVFTVSTLWGFAIGVWSFVKHKFGG